MFKVTEMTWKFTPFNTTETNTSKSYLASAKVRQSVTGKLKSQVLGWHWSYGETQVMEWRWKWLYDHFEVRGWQYEVVATITFCPALCFWAQKRALADSWYRQHAQQSGKHVQAWTAERKKEWAELMHTCNYLIPHSLGSSHKGLATSEELQTVSLSRTKFSLLILFFLVMTVLKPMR